MSPPYFMLPCRALRRGASLAVPLQPGDMDVPLLEWEIRDETPTAGNELLASLMTVIISPPIFPTGGAPGEGAGNHTHDTIESAFASIEFGVSGGGSGAGSRVDVDIGNGVAIVLAATFAKIKLTYPTPAQDGGLDPAAKLVPFGLSAMLVYGAIPPPGNTSTSRRTMLVQPVPNGELAPIVSTVRPIPRFAVAGKLLTGSTATTWQLQYFTNSLGGAPMVSSFSAAGRPANVDAASMPVPNGALFFAVSNPSGFSGSVRVLFDLAI